MLGTLALGKLLQADGSLVLHSETLSQCKSVGGGTKNHSKIEQKLCIYFDSECVFLLKANAEQYRQTWELRNFVLLNMSCDQYRQTWELRNA